MRPIDADALLKSAGIFEIKMAARGCGKSILHLAKVWLFNEVNKAPTIDAVHVVRCKDCKHRPKENRSLDGIIWVEFPEEEICPFNCEDPFYNQMPEDDFFCARGERRSDV